MANADTYLPQCNTLQVDGVHEHSIHPRLWRVGVDASVLHFHPPDNVTRPPTHPQRAHITASVIRQGCYQRRKQRTNVFRFQRQ